MYISRESVSNGYVHVYDTETQIFFAINTRPLRTCKINDYAVTTTSLSTPQIHLCVVSKVLGFNF